MASVYDNIKFANSEYVPQYIGSNYDALKETSDKLDERYRRNKELTDQVQIALANQRIDPLDEPIRAARLKKIQDDIELISSSPENFENSTNAVSQMARELLKIILLKDKKLKQQHKN
jgi:membrane-associated HD superfamily phosphohydrolase